MDEVRVACNLRGKEFECVSEPWSLSTEEIVQDYTGE
jgi:hypothetical protein